MHRSTPSNQKSYSTVACQCLEPLFHTVMKVAAALKCFFSVSTTKIHGPKCDQTCFCCTLKNMSCHLISTLYKEERRKKKERKGDQK